MAQVSNWAVERSSTTGIGTITLAGAVDSFAQFRDDLIAGPIWYSIQDGVNREAGIGDFNGVDEIIRSDVRATLVNGVFDSAPITPITLSGDSLIACTYNASAFIDLLNTNPDLALTNLELLGTLLVNGNSTLGVLTLTSLLGLPTADLGNTNVTGTLDISGALTAASLVLVGLLTSEGVNAGSGNITTTGSISGGALSATTLNTTGLATTLGLDAGAGAIQTTGTLASGNAAITGTLSTTGIATLDSSIITNDLTVNGTIINPGAPTPPPNLVTFYGVCSGSVVATGSVGIASVSQTSIGNSTVTLSSSVSDVTNCVLIVKEHYPPSFTFNDDESTSSAIFATNNTIKVSTNLTHIQPPGPNASSEVLFKRQNMPFSIFIIDPGAQ